VALLELDMQEPPPQGIVAIEEPMMVLLSTSAGECPQNRSWPSWISCTGMNTA
jgi:hypothetical protein